MTYEYTLSKDMQEKYNFTHLLCNGWFGVYNDKFNKKYNMNTKSYAKLNLTTKDIDEIINTSTKCIEY